MFFCQMQEAGAAPDAIEWFTCDPVFHVANSHFYVLSAGGRCTSGILHVAFLNATTPIARLLFDLCYLTFITTVAPFVALLYQLFPAAIALMLSLYLPFFSFFLTVIFPVFVSTLKYFLNLAFFTPVS